MRLAVNALSLIPGLVGGGETYLRNLVHSMEDELREGDRLLVVATRDGARLFDLGSPRSRLVTLPVPGRPRALRLVAEHLALPFVLPALGADVLLSPGNAIPPLAGVRHVLCLQSMHYHFVGSEMASSRVRYFEKMVPLSALRASRVVCVSADLGRSLLRVAPRARSRITVVHEGADLDAFTPAGERAEPAGALLYVSSLNPFKRPDSLVRALGLLRRDGFEPPVTRFAGRPDPADRERVEALARLEGVSDIVEILGVVPHERLAPLYRGASALVYPSALETFGLPPLEAMACGCPVIASNRSSVPEIVGDGAVVVDPDDVPALAAAIRRVLTEPDLRDRLRGLGFLNVGRFTWEAAARSTLEVARAAVLSEML